MGVIEQARERLRLNLRAFVLGPGVVERSDMAWGHDQTEFAPSEYGSYIATSNGVYACVTLRARLLTQLPLRAYRGVGDERSEVTKGPVVDLLRRVNDFWTFNRLMSFTEQSLGMWGSDFIFAERGPTGRGKPMELWWGRADRVKVIPHPVNYIQGFLYEPIIGGEPLFFAPSETIWLRYPNILDEYSGLSPIAAARLAADMASAGMQSNRNIFRNGLQIGGMIYPKSPDTWTVEQADELSGWLDRRFRGVDKAHRWAVLRSEIATSTGGVTPKDAEFLGGMRWALNDIARAYGVPPELIGDHENATYSNIEQANLAIWSHTLLPEARFIAEELTEQLLPMFGPNSGVDVLEFDTSEVSALQPDEDAEWARADAQIQRGAITLNEWRADKGLEPVAWGDVWWAAAGLRPVEDAEPPEPPVMPAVADAPADAEAADAEAADAEAADEEEPPTDEEPQRMQAGGLTRGLAYGSEEHVRLWARFVERGNGWEAQLAAVIEPLFARQQDAVLQRLKQRRGRTVEDAIADPFDMPRWIREFREKVRPVLRAIVEEAGIAALGDIGVGIGFNVSQGAVQSFIEARAQRFAQRVNDTTWNQLRESLSEGIGSGESIPTLETRVKAIMAERIRSTPETIARTEVVGASNGGTLNAWKQSGVVERKVWLAALDDRTRDSHVEAHGQSVGIHEDFVVGGQMGPAPGQIGVPEEDINCRCTMTAEGM